MSDLSTNTRRDELPRFVVYSNGYGWVVADRLVPGTGDGEVPAAFTHGKRGEIVGIYATRELAVRVARGEA